MAYTWTFWIIAIWFVINAIYGWMKRDNQSLVKSFAWINVVVVIVGFWVYYKATPVAGLKVWFMILNWINVILAIIQFYGGFKKNQKDKK